MKRMSMLCGTLLLLLALVGCGGGGGNDVTPTSIETGSARFTITWPSEGRSMTLEVLDGETLLAETTLARPSGGTSIYTMSDLPVGHVTYHAAVYAGESPTGTLLKETRETILINENAVTPATIIGDGTPEGGVVYPVRVLSQVGTTAQLTMTRWVDGQRAALLTPPGSITWTSSDPSVATVDAKGLLTIRRQGDATITARTTDGDIDEMFVTAPKGLPGARGRVAFVNGCDGYDFDNPEIWIVDANGGNLRRLTDNHAWDGDPQFSPDGSRIAFVSDRDGDDDIYTMDPNGGNVRPLTINGAQDYAPANSPDGRKITFISDRDGYRNVYVMNADGSNQQRLTTTTDMASDAHADPAFSPDGRQIVYMAAVPEQFGDYTIGTPQVMVMNADGSNKRQLTTGAEGGRTHPIFTPDGASIIYCEGTVNYRTLRIMDADGGNVRVFPAEGLFQAAFSPTYSPDGNTLLVSTFANSGDHSLGYGYDRYQIYYLDGANGGEAKVWFDRADSATWGP